MKIRQNGHDYTVWTHNEVVRPYVKKFLQEKFPGRLIIDELNKIDLSVPEENLPIEIQTTPCTNGGIHYSSWENFIRVQIDQNIVAYDRCWFFFDAGLLNAMRNASRGMSINMDWFRKYMKEEKLKVFTVSYDGIINELEYKDLDFLSKMSQTCKVAFETDDMVLNRNKMKIFSNVVKGYGFTQEDVDKCNDEYMRYRQLNDDDKPDHRMQFLKKLDDKKSKLYGDILQAVSNLPAINDLLACKQNKMVSKEKWHAKILGIFDIEGSAGYNCITTFVDRFEICKYIPSISKNEEMWNKLKGRNLNERQFKNVISGKSDVVNGIDYYWGVKPDKIDDEGVNVTVECKDQIITVNIKDKDNLNRCKTGQKTIEDAWSI